MTMETVVDFSILMDFSITIAVWPLFKVILNVLFNCLGCPWNLWDISQGKQFLFLNISHVYLLTDSK